MSNVKQKLKIVELCAGIGCQLRGIQNTGLFDVEVVATSEIDRDAAISYAAIHNGLTVQMVDEYKGYPSDEEMRKYLTEINFGYIPEKDKVYDWYKSGKKFERQVKMCWLACQLNRNLGDVTRIEKLPEADVWFLSFPCQSISVAGRLDGIDPDSGTRSSLVWQTIRLLRVAKDTNTLPKYMILENVKNLVGKQFKTYFDMFNEIIGQFGYNTYWDILNAKDCGVPQNRERVFSVYIRKDIDTGKFTFPKPFDNGLRLKDVLEDEVDEKYYINTQKAQELIQKLLDDGIIGNDNPDRQTDRQTDRQSTCLLKTQEKSQSPTAYPQEQTEVSVTDRQRVPVYANYDKIEKVNASYAQTLLSRDYKGFGSSNETSNGIVEKH